MSETTSRVLELLSLLQTHRQWGGPELADRLGVTERTLRRDIERLRELGYSVAATRGVAGGYRLEAGSTMPPLVLTDDEAVVMAIGLRVAASQGLDDGEHTSITALAKFEQVLPPTLRERVNALSGVVRTSSPGQATASQDLIGRLALACRDRERMRFRYTTPGGAEAGRVVEPHTLIATDRAWFLVSWDLERSDWRTFRLDRMSDLTPTRLHFEQRELPGGDAAAFLARSMEQLRRRVEADVVLRMPLAAVREAFGRWGEHAIAVDEHSTSWPLWGGTWDELVSYLSWIPAGVDYEVAGPPEFRAFLRERAERALAASSRAE